MIGPVLDCLAKLDKRYDIEEQFLEKRIRVWHSHLKTDQNDPTIVYSIPWKTKVGDLPFVLSFKLIEGKLAPSPSKFAVEQINTQDVYTINQFEIQNDRVLYARCARQNGLNGAVFLSDKEFNNTDWLPNHGELTLWSCKAVPGCSIIKPFLIAINSPSTKLVLINAVTQDMLEIAVLKRNHPGDWIVQGSI